MMIRRMGIVLVALVALALATSMASANSRHWMMHRTGQNPITQTYPPTGKDAASYEEPVILAFGVVPGGQGATAPPSAKTVKRYQMNHGWLGLETSFPQGPSGKPTVTKVFSGSPAERAGFKVGDVLTSVDGIDFGTTDELARYGVTGRGFQVGEGEIVTVQRGTDIVPLTCVLEQASPQDLSQFEADITGGASSAEK